jgi:predicted RNA-binding protein with EMAP domain
MTNKITKIPNNAQLKGFGIEQRNYVRLNDIKERLQKLQDAEPKDAEWKVAFAETCRDLELYSKNQDKKLMPDGIDRRQNPR